MGLLEILTGKRKLAKPAEDRLFAITTAYVTFETDPEITTRGSAAIVFQSLATADFTSIVRDMEEVVRATATEGAATVETSEDSYGFSWLILRGQDFDSLVVGINAVSTALETGGYGERFCVPCSPSRTAPAAAVLHLQLQAGLVLPVRAGARDSAARQRARAGAQGPGRRRAADRAGPAAVVSAVGNPRVSACKLSVSCGRIPG